MNKDWNILSDAMLRQQNEDLTSYVLRLRGIKDKDRFLNPSYRDLIPNEEMVNIKQGAEIVIDGILKNKRFCIYFDVDIDGVSSGSIMYKYLKAQEVENVKCLINTHKVHGIADRDIAEYDDIDILIVVDSLDENYDVYSRIKEKGIKVVILDHHEFVDYPDDAVLISSAKNYPNKHLSGSGVVWKFCYYLDCLGGSQYSKDLIDLAACGILADVCDMSENSPENRYLVQCGLNNLKNEGLKAIIGSYSFNSQSVLWSIAPLVNAANRTGNNQLAVDLFLTDDKKQLKKIVNQLKDIKLEQDAIVKNAFTDIVYCIEQSNIAQQKVVYGFVETNEFAGLIATKVANMYNKPCIIFHNPDDEGDELKGSIRGFGVDDFREDINSTGLAKCFGHDNAAGIRCKKNDFNKLITAINSKYEHVEFKMETDVDLRIKYEDITERLIIELDKINKLSGKNFKAITVCITDIEVFNATQMQNKHSKFEYYDLAFIKWNDVDLYHAISADSEDNFVTLDVVGELQISNFAGKKKLQVIISDYDDVVVAPYFLRSE